MFLRKALRLAAQVSLRFPAAWLALMLEGRTLRGERASARLPAASLVRPSFLPQELILLLIADERLAPRSVSLRSLKVHAASVVLHRFQRQACSLHKRVEALLRTLLQWPGAGLYLFPESEGLHDSVQQVCAAQFR